MISETKISKTSLSYAHSATVEEKRGCKHDAERNRTQRGLLKLNLTNDNDKDYAIDILIFITAAQNINPIKKCATLAPEIWNTIE